MIKTIAEMETILPQHHNFWHRVRRHTKIWVNRKTLTNRLVSILIGLGIVSGLLTYGLLADMPPFGQNSSVLIILLNVNLVILLALVVLVARRIIALYVRKKRGIVGSNLHIRLVFIFSLLAAIPAIFMAVFSVGFFYFGLHGWLDERVRTAITESQAVAEAYLKEHQQLIGADLVGLVSDLDRQALILKSNPEAMSRMLRTQSYLRNFSNAALIRQNGEVLMQANEGAPLDHGLNIYELLSSTTEQDNIRIIDRESDGMAAVAKLSNYLDTYAYVERDIDPKVLGHVERARRGVAQYEDLQRHSARLQIILTLIYVLITLLLTISAIWFGLSFAHRLMRPITDLVRASEQVREGDWSVRVNTSHAMDEFKTLGRAFNRMTEQIETQRQELVDANTQMDFRRRFTETILGGVSTGVLSIDHNRRISLANNAAGELLHNDIQALLGQKISHIFPDLAITLDNIFDQQSLGTVYTQEIQARRKDNAVRTFLVRIVIENIDEHEKGAIITFDDLTDFLSSQRKSAWADIARRIAHEIKNPLTPIQLSAERLNRKYRAHLNDEDKRAFEQCTETIVRHVDDIKTMVNSFAEFAKMPEAKITYENIVPLINDIYSFQSQAHKGVTWSLNIQERMDSHLVPHDEQQMRQALTNLIKNAVEAIEQKDDIESDGGCIDVIVASDDAHIYIGVYDNGPGLPEEDIGKLTEPYVTHKHKGTGLGLAIVKKIIEDHRGELLFNPTLPILEGMVPNYRKGAGIVMVLPIARDQAV